MTSPAPAAGRPPAASAAPGIRLVDAFGRVATDLRLSLTDRCTLRCTYCMPADGVPWIPREELLSDDELVRVVGVAVQCGIEEVRLTGGEPLLRRGLVELVARLSDLEPRPLLSMTTNALALGRLASALAAAGLERVNVSLDTLRPERFRELTRRDGLDRVIDGLAAAHTAGLRPVKLNAVLQRGVNDDEALDLLEFALEHGYELRFIESMPLDGDHRWRREDIVDQAEILRALEQQHVLEPLGERGSAPATRWLVDGGPTTVGIIASVTQPFCGSCDRLRLTADGQIRTCLFARTETDLRAALRGGASDAELGRLLAGAVAGKAAGHGIGEPGFTPPDRPMSAIGG